MTCAHRRAGLQETSFNFLLDASLRGGADWIVYLQLDHGVGVLLRCLEGRRGNTIYSSCVLHFLLAETRRVGCRCPTFISAFLTSLHFLVLLTSYCFLWHCVSFMGSDVARLLVS